MKQDGFRTPVSGEFLRAESPDLVARRIKAEYHEMPGLDLTFVQARCLFGLESRLCERVLDRLCAEGFLVRTTRGSYRSAA